MIRIVIDYENNAEQWWPAAVDSAAELRCPTELLPLFTNSGLNEVTVTVTAAHQARVWARSLPGWNDGPTYAPHPLLFLNL